MRKLGFSLLWYSLPSSRTRSKIRLVDPLPSEAALLPCCKYPYPFLVLCFEVQFSQSHAIRTATSLGKYFRRVSFLSPGFEGSYSTGLQYMTAFSFFMRSIFFMELIEICFVSCQDSHTFLVPQQIYHHLHVTQHCVFHVSPVQGPIPLCSLAASTNIIQNLPYYFNKHLFFWYLTP